MVVDWQEYLTREEREWVKRYYPDSWIAAKLARRLSKEREKLSRMRSHHSHYPIGDTLNGCVVCKVLTEGAG